MPSRPHYVFLLSGFSSVVFSDLRAELVRKILELNGIYHETDTFKPSCTHLICSTLSRSEKVLGACVTGKWILMPTYIHESFEQGKWLDEEPFEWREQLVQQQITNHMLEIYRAPKRCRLKVKKNQAPLFTGWVVALFVQDLKKRLVYKRLLECGGATVLKSSAQQLTLKFLNLKVKYIFVTSAPSILAKRYLQINIVCIHPDFIRNFILQLSTNKGSALPLKANKTSAPFMDQPPSVLDFLASTYIPNTDPLFISPKNLTNVLRVDLGSKVNNYKNLQPEGTKKRKLSSSQETSTSFHFTEISNRPKSNFKKMKFRKEKNNTELTQFFQKIPNIQNRGLLTENKSRANDFRYQVEIASSGTENISSQTKEKHSKNSAAVANSIKNADFGLKCLTNSLASAVSTDNSNKKLTFTRSQLEQAVSVVQIKKASMFINYWKIHLQTTEDEQKIFPTEMSEHFVRMFDICRDGDWQCALEYIYSCISKKHYLPTRILHSILLSLTEPNVDKISSNLALQIFAKTLSCIPPHNQHNRQYYLQILSFDGKEMGNCKQPWNFICRIISDCFDGMIDESKDKFEVNYLLLNLIIRLLLQDFSSFVQRSNNASKELKLVNRQPLIARILWPNTIIGQTNGPCSQLFQHLINIASRRGNDKELLLNLVQELINLMMECCRISEITSFIETLPGPTAYVLGRELADYLSVNLASLIGVLQSIQLPWVQMIVAEKLLDDFRNPFTDENSFLVRSRLSMKKIVAYYMYLIPANVVPSVKDTPGLEKPMETFNSPSKTSLDTPLLKNIQVNKRNLKGETMLHRACKSNQTDRVKKLLSTPGIDVNAVDNEGWTPLHEACNYGSTESVMELIKFRPIQKTIHMYFSGDGQNKCGEVNLKCKSKDGTTPLHDAVVNNNIDIVRMLLEAGGVELLEIQNCNHQTPADIARTKEMSTLLEDYKVKQQVSSSEIHLLALNEIPDYGKILGDSASRKSIPYHVYKRYITLVFFLIKGYLETSGLREIRVLLSKKSKLSDKGFSKHIPTNEEMNKNMMEDIVLYGKYQKYITRFFDHIDQITEKEFRCSFDIHNFRFLCIHE